MMNSKHCVIVGSGLGGLACGVMLARNGWRVTVLEQQRQVGGCLQCFVRNGAKFETGMHYIGSARQGQVLDRLLRYLGVLDDIELSPLDTSGYDRFSFDGARYQLATGREALVDQLCRYFPSEHSNIERYCDLVEQVAGASQLHSLSLEATNTALSTRAQTTSIDTVLARITGNERLRDVLAGNIPLYAGQREATSFATHAFIMHFYNQSSYRVVGGSDNIAQSLVHTIARLGGETLTCQKVEKITCDDHHATGVVTANGRYYPADVVIADLHPARVTAMVDSPLFRPIYRHRIATLPATIGCFSLYLDFNDNEVPYMNYNFFGYAQDSPWDCEKYTASDWPRGYLYMHMCNEAHQQYARSGIVLSYMRYSDVAPWQGTRVGHRGPDYEALKHDHALRLLKLVEKDFPGLGKHVRKFYTSTPLTYADYTGTERGSMYGVAHDIRLGSACRVHHRTKVPNLLLTGQNINSHGILGVLVGAIVTCSELLTPSLILSQINKANQ